MRIRSCAVQYFEIQDAPNLDPIRVYVENYEEGKGRITISCYDRAWVGYWGAMGKRTIEQFLIEASPDYIAGNLLCGAGLSRAESYKRYLHRVIEAVQSALREVLHVS